MANNTFHALAHPIRRHVVERLARGSATIGEATRGLGVSKPAVSKHLKLLEEIGVVGRTIEGRQHRLRLETRPLDEASRWLDRHRRLWESKFDAIERHLDDEGRSDGGS